MRVLNRENQHEIGFDVNCLPAWAKYIAMDSNNEWWCYVNKPRPYDLIKGQWYCHSSYSDRRIQLPKEYVPKKFSGHWKESLFKIDE